MFRDDSPRTTLGLGHRYDASEISVLEEHDALEYTIFDCGLAPFKYLAKFYEGITPHALHQTS